DAVDANQPVRLQHIGETARHHGHLVERGARGNTILVDIDQRWPIRAVGVTVAAGGRDVEACRNVPAEIADELVVTGGFRKHGTKLDDRGPGINPPRLFSVLPGLPCKQPTGVPRTRRLPSQDNKTKTGETPKVYDIIIVGGGSAGSV